MTLLPQRNFPGPNFTDRYSLDRIWVPARPARYTAMRLSSDSGPEGRPSRAARLYRSHSRPRASGLRAQVQARRPAQWQ